MPVEPNSVAVEANRSPSVDDEWSRLMAAGLQGNGGAYHRLLSEVGPWLIRYYARRLPTGQVDDAAQDALVALHLKRHTYAVDRPFRPWLAAIARYKWIDRLRSMGRDTTDELREDVACEGDHGSDVVSAMVLNDLLDRLKPAQATVIRLVKLQGYSIEEVAASTGQSESLVKVNIHRGLGKLATVVCDRDPCD